MSKYVSRVAQPKLYLNLRDSVTHTFSVKSFNEKTQRIAIQIDNFIHFKLRIHDYLIFYP